MRHQIYEDIYRAELTHWWFCARRSIVAALIRRFASPHRPLRVADVGCGMGSTLTMLTEFGTVIGLDYSPTALAFSQQRGQRRLVTAALPHLPLPTGSCDVVCALDVIEHIDDDGSAVRELWRICKPAGLMVITVPAYNWLWSEHDDVNEHKRRYVRSELQRMLALPGARVLRLSYMNFVLAPPLIAFRLIQKLIRRRKTNPNELTSDVRQPSSLVNRLFYHLFAAEAAWLQHGRLPFGISLIALVRKHAT